MKIPTATEIDLLIKLKKMGVEFEPADDWHGAYYVYHHDKTFPWADGEDKPYYKPSEFVWIPSVDDCLEWLREKKYRIEFYWNDYGITIELHHDEKGTMFFDRKKQPPLEALLRAVLEILK